MYFGVDVSKHQGSINWSAVKQNGFNFAMIRIAYRGWGDGVIHQDDNAVKNIDGCISAGIPYGIYFFSQATSEAEAREEAQYCLDFIHSHSYKPEYPICLDQEKSGDEYERGRADHNTDDLYAACAVAFCETIEKADCYAIIYCSESWYNSKLKGAVDKYDLWIRKWLSVEPRIARAYGIWQNSNNGTSEGISTRIDTNVTNIDYPSVIKSKGLNGWSQPAGRKNILLTAVKWLFETFLKGGTNEH